jgi:hypothetical protein
MGMQYSHLLIATPLDYAPRASDIARFFRALALLGAAPMREKSEVRKGTGQVRKLWHPFRQQEIALPIYDHVRLQSMAECERVIGALSDYSVTMAGVGPPARPPLVLNFDGEYSLAVRCHVRPTPVVMSQPHEEWGREPEPQIDFKEDPDTATFRSPTTGRVFKLPGAGFARFWIEFELGKFLFPEVHDTLDLLDPAIVNAAVEVFQTHFTQGAIGVEGKPDV